MDYTIGQLASAIRVLKELHHQKMRAERMFVEMVEEMTGVKINQARNALIDAARHTESYKNVRAEYLRARKNIRKHLKEAGFLPESIHALTTFDEGS